MNWTKMVRFIDDIGKAVWGKHREFVFSVRTERPVPLRAFLERRGYAFVESEDER